MDTVTPPPAPAFSRSLSPDQFREWANLFSEALLLLSKDGLILAANDGAASLLDRAVAGLIGLRFSSLVAQPAHAIDLYLEALFHGAERASALLPITAREGQPIGCLAEGRAVRSADPGAEPRILLRLRAAAAPAAGLSALNRRVDELTLEVTRRKEVEEALRESEARYRTQVEHAPEAIVVLDAATGRFVDANENAACLFGTSKEALLQVGPVDLSPPTQPDGTLSREAAKRHIDHALAGGVPVFEWTHRNTAGEDVPCEIRLVRLPTAGRNLVRGSVTDIRARKWAEQRVLRLNRLYYILSEINEAILRIRDLDQLYERVCRIAVQGGLLRMAWVGIVDPLTQAVRPAAHWGFEAGYLEQIRITAADEPEGRGPMGTAIRQRRVDICNDLERDPRVMLWREAIRKRGYRSLAVFPLIVEDRAIGGLALYAAEADFFKADEIHLMESLANNLAFVISMIEQDKRRRQAEENEARLIREQRQLEEQFRQSQKMEAVGRLAGGVAHDFNNLLTVITGYTDLLLSEQSANQPSRELLEEIQKAAGRATALTSQLLAFSRKQVLQTEVLDLNAVVGTTEKMLRRLIGEHINLVTVLDPCLGRVRADRGQIEQSLMNLVVNARDAMPQGGHLTIETRNVEVETPGRGEETDLRAGSYVLLTVTDTGIGMSRETLKHLFEPFFTTKEVGRGTGLGLATIYGIVKQSDGHIEVLSEPGHGSTFHIYLPRLPQLSALPLVAPRDRPRAQPGSETILLVEDEDAVRNLASFILKDNGYTVLEARDGQEAVHISGRHKAPIDLLLADVVMPGMSGRELADRLRLSRPEMRVLYQSGYTDDAIVHYGIAGAATSFLQKPYTAAVLTQKVREVLEQKRQMVP